MPATRSTQHSAAALLRNPLVIAGIAFGFGLLLFVMVWLIGRNARKDDPAPAQPVAAQPAAKLPPLPAPLPAGDGASDMPDAPPPPTPDETATLVETAPPAPPAPLPEQQAASPATAAAPGDRPLPLQGQMPPPRYPAAALRRGDSGRVVVRVDVDASGNPGGVTLIERSGSRELDRAAMEAVRGWRFQPAQRDGRPVPGSIDVPFDFKADR